MPINTISTDQYGPALLSERDLTIYKYFNALNATATKNFIKTLWKFHKDNRRDLPWRNTHDPYKILVSEMMLQQTQVARVLIKYEEFLKSFPTLKVLARTPITEVLKIWKGLGYNRRAFFLKRISGEVMKNHSGHFPNTYEEMIKLPGIGQSTAGAVSAFAFEKKVPFIETNIRAVLIHSFFALKKSVTDQEVKAKLEEILTRVPTGKVREFYYALYDYGTVLKATLGKDRKTLHAKSKQYKKQSSFIGSNRQLRAIILQYILEMDPKPITTTQISTYIRKRIEKSEIPFEANEKTEALIETILQTMQKEKQIMRLGENKTKNKSESKKSKGWMIHR